MISLVWNTVVLLVLLVVHSGSGQVPRNQLFQFGSSNGDTKLVRDSLYLLYQSDPITLLSPFTFFNKTHPALHVSYLGNILFTETGFYSLPWECDSNERSSHGTRIAPFWSVVSLDHGGQASYRETTNPSLISKAQDEVMKGFPDEGVLPFKSVFIATWDNVAHGRYPSCPDDNLRNTFQAILASDGMKSFVIFYYNQLTWTAEEGSGCMPTNYYPATAGFTAGVGHPFQDILEDCESDVLKLTENSNMGVPGKWLFRVDKSIESPNFYNSESTIIEHIQNSSVDNQTIHSDDSDHSGSSKNVISLIGFCFSLILVIRSIMYV